MIKRNGVLFVVGLCLVTACADGDYDLSNVDMLLGLDLNLTSPSDNNIKELKLEDFIELEESSAVVVDSTTGDYYIRTSNDNVDEIEINVKKVVLDCKSENSEETYDLLDVDKSYFEGSEIGNVAIEDANLKFTETIAEFEWMQDLDIDDNSDEEGSYADILELDSVGISTDLVLTLNLSQDLIKAAEKYNENGLKILFDAPDYFYITGTTPEGEVTDEGANIFKIGFNEGGDCQVTFHIKGIRKFNEDPEKATGSYAKFKPATIDGNERESGKLEVYGIITANIETELDIDPSKTYTITTKYEPSEEIVFQSATGKFSSKGEKYDAGETELNDIPDFLKDEEVTLNIANPMFKFDVLSDMTVNYILNVYFESGGGFLDEVKKDTLPEIHLDASKDPSMKESTSVLVYREEEGKMSGDFDYKIQDQNLWKLVNKVPGYVNLNAVSMIDSNRVGTILFDHTYHVKPNFTLNTPLKFGSNTTLVYRDSIVGWYEDILDDWESMTLEGGMVVEVSFTAENKLPVNLELKAWALDENNDSISSNLISIDVEGKIEAGDSINTKSSPIKLTIQQKEDDAFKTYKLNGIAIKAYGKTEDMEGETLNSKKHTLILKDIYVALKGKMIYDAN